MLATRWDEFQAACILVFFWVGWKFWDMAQEIGQTQGENIAKPDLGLGLI